MLATRARLRHAAVPCKRGRGAMVMMATAARVRRTVQPGWLGAKGNAPAEDEN